jgi:hypothetical protein
MQTDKITLERVVFSSSGEEHSYLFAGGAEGKSSIVQHFWVDFGHVIGIFNQDGLIY